MMSGENSQVVRSRRNEKKAKQLKKDAETHKKTEVTTDGKKQGKLVIQNTWPCRRFESWLGKNIPQYLSIVELVRMWWLRLKRKFETSW